MTLSIQEAEVWQFVQEMNKVWAVEGNTAALKNCFHEKMVAVVPTNGERIEGRDACIAGWKSFVDAATIHYWKETDPLVQIYLDGKYAVVTYYYETSVDMFGQSMVLKGRDMMTLINEDGKWWLVADQFSPFPG